MYQDYVIRFIGLQRSDPHLLWSRVILVSSFLIGVNSTLWSGYIWAVTQLVFPSLYFLFTLLENRRDQHWLWSPQLWFIIHFDERNPTQQSSYFGLWPTESLYSKRYKSNVFIIFILVRTCYGLVTEDTKLQECSLLFQFQVSTYTETDSIRKCLMLL